MTFARLGINPGEILTYNRVAGIQCIVHDEKSVEYEGEVTSLFALTMRLLREKEGLEWPSVRGQAYWSYNGATLTDLYEAAVG